jgi:hypothetical protein
MALLIGALVAIAFVIGVRRLRADRASRVYAIGLVVAALIYLVFAAGGGASGRSLALEAFGVLLYGAVAWAGMRLSMTVLALGWAGHAAWDLLIHTRGIGAAYTPDWYPWACVGFDLVIAIAILARGQSRDLRKGTA